MRAAPAVYGRPMERISLSYFDSPNSRGEECRLALVLAGVDFHDDRIPSAEWPARKATMPYGAVPVLEVGGRKLAQSNAVLRYIAREYGLEAPDPWQRALEDAVMESAEEMRMTIWQAVRSGSTPDEKIALRQALAEGPLPRWAQFIEAQIQGPFIGGDTIRVADLKLFMIHRWLTGGIIDHLPGTVLDPFPKFVQLAAAVGAHPKVAAWRARFA